MGDFATVALTNDIYHLTDTFTLLKITRKERHLGETVWWPLDNISYSSIFLKMLSLDNYCSYSQALWLLQTCRRAQVNSNSSTASKKGEKG